MSRKDNAASRFRGLLSTERRSADMYAGLAEAATGERREILSELAAVERRHAAHWANKLRQLGERVPDAHRSDVRTAVLTWFARRFSIDAVLPYLERAGKPTPASTTATRTPPSRWPSTNAPTPGSCAAVARPQRTRLHPSARTMTPQRPFRALRAAVFGINDGLVSNASLVMGFAGSGAASTVILFAGLAGLLAGAFSMAAGEYISMRSQREAHQREIELEATELRDDPDAEAEELALIYRAKGLDEQQATEIAAAIMADRDIALDTMAREELGLDPSELGSPWSAAISSLLAFALGAIVVVVPYLFGSGEAALISAVAFAGVVLFAVGAAIGVLNGRDALRSGARQLLVGGAAALVVFAIGHLLGASAGSR